MALETKQACGKRNASLTLLLAACLLPASCSEPAGSAQAPTIPPADLEALLESGAGPVVIDVRSSQEYEAGHIPGALNIPFDQIADRIGEVEAPAGVALYCMVGPRARKGEAALRAVGYEAILHLEGGLSAWEAQGLPVARGP